MGAIVVSSHLILQRKISYVNSSVPFLFKIDNNVIMVECYLIFFIFQTDEAYVSIIDDMTRENFILH